MKDKPYYIGKYNEFFDYAVDDGEFEEVATAEEIVGYYLVIYQERAFEQWKENLHYAKKRWKDRETETDEEVTKILSELFKEGE